MWAKKILIFMSWIQTKLETEVIKCDNVKWKSVGLLFSALVAEEHIGNFHVVEVVDTFRDDFPAKSPEIICCLVLNLNNKAKHAYGISLFFKL